MAVQRWSKYSYAAAERYSRYIDIVDVDVAAAAVRRAGEAGDDRFLLAGRGARDATGWIAERKYHDQYKALRTDGHTQTRTC